MAAAKKTAAKKPEVKKPVAKKAAPKKKWCRNLNTFFVGISHLHENAVRIFIKHTLNEKTPASSLVRSVISILYFVAVTPLKRILIPSFPSILLVRINHITVHFYSAIRAQFCTAIDNMYRIIRHCIRPFQFPCRRGTFLFFKKMQLSWCRNGQKRHDIKIVH